MREKEEQQDCSDVNMQLESPQNQFNKHALDALPNPGSKQLSVGSV